MARRVDEIGHLTRRFVASFGVVVVRTDDEWALSQLSACEGALWATHAPVDRAHTVRVARHVARRAGLEAPTWLVPAALLHDIGKTDARLGPVGRAVATVLELARVPRAPGVLGRYLTYPERGAALLTNAGAAPQTIAWAREHHLAPSQWTLPRPWAELLAAADSGPGE